LATKKLTTIVIDALEDIKARDIRLINVTRLTSVFDYIAIASADSTRQTKALAHNVMDKVKENGGWIYGIEGEDSGEWVLVDCGDIVVHVMRPQCVSTTSWRNSGATANSSIRSRWSRKARGPRERDQRRNGREETTEKKVTTAAAAKP
jgi:ribosome-associated protein